MTRKECQCHTRSIGTQTEIEAVYDNTPPVLTTNCLGIIELSRMEDFIVLTCRHAANVGLHQN